MTNRSLQRAAAVGYSKHLRGGLLCIIFGPTVGSLPLRQFYWLLGAAGLLLGKCGEGLAAPLDLGAIQAGSARRAHLVLPIAVMERLAARTPALAFRSAQYHSLEE